MVVIMMWKSCKQIINLDPDFIALELDGLETGLLKNFSADVMFGMKPSVSMLCELLSYNNNFQE